MRLRIPASSIPGVMVCLALLLARTSAAQIPDKFTNLKVLPKNITKDRLISVMRGFSMGLGVRCEHCHVDDDTSTPKRVDFASDEKKEKKIARVMMKMASEINGSLLPKTGIQSPAQVRCVTCHHGLPRPETLADAVEEAIQKGGVQAGQDKYRQLREKYYGSAAYDFRPLSLAQVAEWLAGERKDLDGAISVIQFSLGIDPNAAESYVSLGRMQEAKGDKPGAIASYKKALELQPENERVQQQLQQLESGK
jgi:photosynthetic reaction center cytochrome c subunit